MIQFRFDIHQAKDMLHQFGYVWELDPAKARQSWVSQYGREWPWVVNLTRLIDELTKWCHDSGIKKFAFGFTQIEFCATFEDKADAALFKLRWHYV